MKHCLKLVALAMVACLSTQAQDRVTENQRKQIAAVIDTYSLARETRDTILLKTILTDDIDQLVSTGEWRDGVNSSVKGMLRSSANNAGKRTLTVDKIRLIDSLSAVVDCRYVIESQSDKRNMWSTFILVKVKRVWKITAIRNMAPSGQ